MHGKDVEARVRTDGANITEAQSMQGAVHLSPCAFQHAPGAVVGWIVTGFYVPPLTHLRFFVNDSQLVGNKRAEARPYIANTVKIYGGISQIPGRLLCRRNRGCKVAPGRLLWDYLAAR
ncbi:unnamed protein product [Echinostoma caproni]|uniref:Peptidase S1 domain-containing protein n=1 Tax=Echinostoma caproni TaxID=27848 RepID=A0A183B6L8_9TREM|nr:unnamed protein product [Echinostoma caproni]